MLVFNSSSGEIRSTVNKRTLTKYCIYTVAVLSATLINEFIVKYIKTLVHERGYLLVLIDMLIVLLIFAPAFGLVSTYTKKISNVYIKTSKKVGTSNNGLWLGFLVAFGILFVSFAYLRHHIDVIHDLQLVLNRITPK